MGSINYTYEGDGQTDDLVNEPSDESTLTNDKNERDHYSEEHFDNYSDATPPPSSPRVSKLQGLTGGRVQSDCTLGNASNSLTTVKKKLQQFMSNHDERETPRENGVNLRYEETHRSDQLRERSRWVWKFMIKTPKGGDCNLCLRSISSEKTTTNLAKHLTRNHRDNQKVMNAYSQLKINPAGTAELKLSTLRKPSSPTPKTEQPRIDHSFSQINSFKDGGIFSGKLKNALLYMVVKDDMPLSCTEKEGLKHVLSVAAPHFLAPGRNSMTRCLEQKYLVLSSQVKHKLQSFHNFTLTADVWTDTNTTRGYLGITLHFWDGSQLISHDLETMLLTKNRTAEYLSQKFKEFLEK
nr:PREDICTED: uncharacterized protein LOC105271657 [Fopius arisanus]